MAETKLGIFFVLLVLIIAQVSFTEDFTVSGSDNSQNVLPMEIRTVMSFDEIYSLQKDPEKIGEAERQFLYTLMNAPELLGDESVAEYLGKRIFTKKQIIADMPENDQLLILILKENTEGILDYLREKSVVLEGYEDKYELLDFVLKDYQNSMLFYSLQKLKNYLNIIYMKDFNSFFSLSAEELDFLAEKLVDNFVNSRIDFNNSTIKKLVIFGGENLLLRLGVRITPLVMLIEEGDFKKEYDLLSIMRDLYASYSESLGAEKAMLPQLAEKFDKLKGYFSLRENIEILDRRMLTIEKDSLDEMIPLVCEYVREYENVKLKKEAIKTALINLINNTVSRYSYETGLKLSDESLEAVKNTGSSINDVEVTLRYFQKSQSVPDGFEESASESDEAVPERTGGIFYGYLPLIVVLAAVTVALAIITIPRRNRAYLLKKLGSKKRALEIFQKLSFENPRDPDLHVAMAQLLEEMNREEEAISEYRLASKLVDLDDRRKSKK